MIYMFLANGMEEIEALCPLDIMRRAGLEVTTVGIGGREITGAHGITVKADIADLELNDASAQLIFLPGGMPGTLNLAASDTVKNAIDTALKNDSYIAAICAAPSILGDMGILRGKEAICYPGFEDRLTGAKISDKRVVLDGKIITAAGMGVALDMGLLIVEILCGKEAAAELRRAVIAD
ncbi:MAG: DJ-1/PfpI family protein [Ruminococcaceae bacterium]|nr:DJ-1/PfpI family protein [Oscillospiraceae bacterium]